MFIVLRESLLKAEFEELLLEIFKELFEVTCVSMRDILFIDGPNKLYRIF